MSQPWSDGVMDSIALVECVRRDCEHSVLDIQVILRNGNVGDIAVSLAKMLAEVASEYEVDPVWFRRWLMDAVRRP
jgi:hypothetical protein